jgi:hypothetical protein
MTLDSMHFVLDRVMRFPFNVDKLELLEAVYGPTNATNAGYKDSKLTELSENFARWYCNLDLANQRIVAKAILDRYPELTEGKSNR